MTDVKAWRRSVMSDGEARRICINERISLEAGCAAVLDEFVRRLGQMTEMHAWGKDGLARADTHPPKVCKEGTPCCPAVLFVQPEKPKARLSDAEKVERALAYIKACRPWTDAEPIERILRGESE